MLEKILQKIKPRKETMKLKGTMILEQIRDGKVIDKRVLKNIIVNVGKAKVAGLINGVTSGPFTYLAVGSGTTAESATDTALQSEWTTNGLARAQATCSRTTTSVTNDTAVLEYTWTATGSATVTEAGAFDASSGGNMLNRKTFSAFTLAANDQLKLTVKIQVS